MAIATVPTGQSLNPFYFRAGLLLVACRKAGWKGGLNPFYFRAGLLPPNARKALAAHGVLIPFISGLDCYELLRIKAERAASLNPFYFRAGLLPAGCEKAVRRVVS